LFNLSERISTREENATTPKTVEETPDNLLEVWISSGKCTALKEEKKKIHPVLDDCD
jgi:hypothetical protein